MYAMESEAVEWTTVPHVVVVPESLTGHAIPFLQFARRLAAEGIVTTVVTTDRHVLELESLVGSTDLTPKGIPLRLLGLRDKKAHLSHFEWSQQVRKVREEELNVIRLLQEVVTDVASPESWQLRGVHPAASPFCILHDMFVSTWAQEAAEKIQIEKHLFYVSPASALSCALQSNRLFREGRVPITRENRDTVLADIPGLPPTWALNLPSPFLNPAMYDWMRLRHLRYQMADVILVNTFYDLEKPVLDALRNEVIGALDTQVKHFLDIGPLLPEAYVNEDRADAIIQLGSEEKDPCIHWLNTRPPTSVLYVSFGSIATHSAPQLLELALGLEASGSSFLWIVRPPDAPDISAASGAPTSVTEFLPPGFEERMEDRAMCYSGWVPQMRILKHPAVGGFLSHCGWNSILETVCAGVPVLAWPKKAEQHLNRRFLVDTLKMAIELEGNAFTKEELESDEVSQNLFVSKVEIERKARSLMQETEGQFVRENIQKLRVKSRAVGAPGGSSRRNFEAYVRLLHRK